MVPLLVCVCEYIGSRIDVFICWCIFNMFELEKLYFSRQLQQHCDIAG